MKLELIPLDEPSEVREFDKGRFELYRVGPMTIGRASYEPGWRWSEHVGAATGDAWCEVEHVGLVVSGRAMAAMRDGDERVMEPVSSSTCRPATTAGSSATSHTSRCTSWGPRTTRRATPRRETRVAGGTEPVAAATASAASANPTASARQTTRTAGYPWASTLMNGYGYQSTISPRISV